MSESDHAGIFGRCRWHGGRSTGAKTPEGKERQRQGTKRYWQWMRELGIRRIATQESREKNRQGQLRRWKQYRADRARQRREADDQRISPEINSLRRRPTLKNK